MSAAPASSLLGEASGSLDQRGIPFDLLFTFRLTGTPERMVSETATVSIEGPFVAHAIGYGMVPVTPRFRFGVPRPQPVILFSGGGSGATPALASPLSFAAIVDSLKSMTSIRRELTFSAENELRVSRKPVSGPPLVETVLRNGFRLNPETADLVLMALLDGKAPSLSDEALQNLFESVATPPDRIQFRYALHDQGSGRAFQSDPILSTAGLGSAEGERPFRRFARAITFAPQTVIRMDVIEVSPFPGTLYVALHGFKVLGTTGTPTDLRRLARRSARRSRGAT